MQRGPGRRGKRPTTATGAGEGGGGGFEVTVAMRAMLARGSSLLAMASVSTGGGTGRLVLATKRSSHQEIAVFDVETGDVQAR
jgi:hypothetical protein